MKTIPLTQSKQAIVDDEDHDAVSHYRWCAMKIGKAFYAAAWIGWQRMYLHRFLMSPPDGMQVDHINGDSLDNRRANLRICTPRQQSMNTKPKRDHRKFKGVRSPARGRSRWDAYICANRKFHYLGSFATEIEAAKAYDVEARKLHGEFAHLNFP